MDTEVLTLQPGRPSPYDENLLQRIENALAAGATRSAAATSSGITRETFYAWTRQFPYIADRFARAEGEFRRNLEERFATHALKGDDWRAAHAYLQSNPQTRADWGPTVNLSAVPLEKLRELIDGGDNSSAWPSLQEEQRQLTTVDNNTEQEQDSAAE